jgi:glutathione S-transferase
MSKNLAILDSALEGKSFIANDKLSIADFYLTTAFFEIKHFAINDLTNFKNLEKYLDKMMNDKNIKEVPKSEGLAK